MIWVLVIILIFGWMNAHFAFVPIMPDQPFDVTLKFSKNIVGDVMIVVPEGIEILGNDIQSIENSKAIYTLKGKEGRYVEGNALKFEFGGGPEYKDVIITNDYEYTEKIKKVGGKDLKNIEMGYKKRVILPVLNWGWLGTYIIFSIVFSMRLRKILKLH